MADLPNRDKYEKKLAAIVRRGFKPHRNAQNRRQPRYAEIRKEVQADLEKMLDWVRLDAARNLIAKYGKSPAPFDWKPPSGRAADLMVDLEATSRKAWKKIPRPLTDESVAKWRAKYLGEDRIRNIAETELTMAHQAGEDAALEVLKAQGVYLEGIWKCEPNCCQFCERVRDKPERIWRKIYPKGPPSPHVGCKCYIEHHDKMNPPIKLGPSGKKKGKKKHKFF